VILAPADKLDGMLNRKRDKAIAAGLSPAAQPELDPAELKQEGGKLGSNEGGTFTDKAGNKFYIKRPETKAHVENELAASRLYKLAGVGTLDYRPVKGGNHVATAWEQLDKNNISKMTAAERKEATKDFAVHAWLSNWDAAGTGGDNQGVRGGKPVTLDVGGSLRYRAQGTPKGAAFGNKVTEVDTMRDPGKSHDAAKLFGKMSESDLKSSVERVTSIPDAAIRSAVGSDSALADTLIARKQDLAKRFGTQAADEAHFEEGKHPRDPDGKFASGGGGGTGRVQVEKGARAHLLSKGTTTQEMLKALGWPSISMPQMAKTLGMKLEKTTEGGVTKYKGTPMTEAEKSAEKGKAQLAAAAKAEAAKLAAAQAGKLKDDPGPLASMAGKTAPPLAAPTFAQEGLASKHGPATAAELVKAKKSVALQLQYVPGAPQTPAAQALVDKFNAKWAGKEG
jgi:hypothetical protein